MALTLNQIVKRFRSLALSHRQLRSFYFIGPRESIEIRPDAQFGVCIVQQLPGEINRTEKLNRFNFRVYFLDKVGVSEDTAGNELDVLSDMNLVAQDFMAMLYDPDYQHDWDITEINESSPEVEFLEDMLSGYTIAIGVSVPYMADRCAVPSGRVEEEGIFTEQFNNVFA